MRLHATLCFALLFALAGCTSTTATDAGTDMAATDGGNAVDGPTDAGLPDLGHDAGPPDLGTPYDMGTITRMPEATLAPMRAGCSAFGRGAFAAQTVGMEYPVGTDIPIQHFVIFMQENRSFDHYFGHLPSTDVDGTPSTASNDDSAGAHVPAYHETHYCTTDEEHGWNAVHAQYNGGAMDGFVTSNEFGGMPASGHRAMGYFTEADLPFYYDLYARFAMSDRHFCALLGPTWPNRDYFYAASSHGKIDNTPPAWPTDGSEYVIMQELDHVGVSWKVYATDVPFLYGGFPTYGIGHSSHVKTLTQLTADITAGTLPQVTWIDPAFSGGVMETDEHPPADPQFGEQFVHDTIVALLASPLWATTAIILTYDEHGGFYDHVVPPAACPPGDGAPLLGTGDVVADFDRHGVRVPLAIISPWSKAHYVSHEVTDHTSVLRLLEARYGMPALTARDANAWPLLDMFDFAAPPFMTAPTGLAAAPIDPAAVATCHTDGF